MQLLNEAKWEILKLLGGFLLLFYLVVTGIHMSNRLPIDRAIFGVNIDARVIINCPTNTRRIWEVIDRSRKNDDVLKSDGRFGDHYTEECG
jgi:hypothetical protein